MNPANLLSSNLLRAAAVFISLGSVVPAASAQMMPGPGPASLVMPADYEFVVRAAYSGWGEIAAAQTALRNSGDPRIRDIANMMIADHTAANQQLASIAATRGHRRADDPGFGEPGHAHDDAADGGPAFDSAYLMQQVADHRTRDRAVRNRGGFLARSGAARLRPEHAAGAAAASANGLGSGLRRLDAVERVSR